MLGLSLDSTRSAPSAAPEADDSGPGRAPWLVHSMSRSLFHSCEMSEPPAALRNRPFSSMFNHLQRFSSDFHGKIKQIHASSSCSAAFFPHNTELRHCALRLASEAFHTHLGMQGAEGLLPQQRAASAQQEARLIHSIQKDYRHIRCRLNHAYSNTLYRIR